MACEAAECALCVEFPLETAFSIIRLKIEKDRNGPSVSAIALYQSHRTLRALLETASVGKVLVIAINKNGKP